MELDAEAALHWTWISNASDAVVLIATWPVAVGDALDPIIAEEMPGPDQTDMEIALPLAPAAWTCNLPGPRKYH